MGRLPTRIVAFAALAIVVLAGCGDSAEGSGDDVTLSLAAYSTPREAYEEIIPAFQETAAGADVSFDMSFGSSGEQSRAVVDGLAADIVALSLEPDITRLINAELVDANWNQDSYHGLVTNSVVVLVVREGNPKNIQDWDDLLQPGIEVINPNPFTSGGAKWNIMAAYGAQLNAGKTHDEAVEYLAALMAQVPVQDKSAREALQTFAGGKGDVMLAYENEAITAQQKGEDLAYIIPASTILIENPVALVSTSEHPEAAQAFLDYLREPEAQRIFGEKGYRPVNAEVLAEFAYPQPTGLFTIAELGGWSDVNARFFDVDTGIMAEIQRSLGAPLE